MFHSDRTFVTVSFIVVVVVSFDGQVKECLVSFQLLNKLTFSEESSWLGGLLPNKRII